MSPAETRWSLKDVGISLFQLGAFSLAPILSFWADNVAHDPRIRPLIAISAGLFVVTGLVLFFGRRSRAALLRVTVIESVIMIALFNWTAFSAFRERPPYMVGSEHLLGVVLLAAFVLMMYRIGPSPVLRALLTAMAAVVLLTSGFRLGNAELDIHDVRLRQTEVSARSPAGRPPDIFYLVLDGYGRADVLSKDYGLDQTGFLAELARRGFVVPPAARANYPMTVVSVPSVLAMDFPLEPGAFLGDSEERALNDVRGGSNPVLRFLKSKEYSYVHVESELPETQCGRAADRCIRWFSIDDTVLGLLEATPFAPLLRTNLHSWLAAETLTRFDRLSEVARSAAARPRFVFAHVLLPHPPLFLRADCSIDVDIRRSDTIIGGGRYHRYLELRKDAYAEQIRCLNDRVLRFLDDLPSDAIVVLAADHGPDSRGQLVKPSASWTRDDIEERMSIFAAFRLPAGCRDEVPMDASLVNTFRIVLNCGFGAQLPLLPNRTLLVLPREVVIDAPPG